MVAILGYSREQILTAVQGMYTVVAEDPDAGFHFPVGRSAARLVGYPQARLDALPHAVGSSFAGVGYPFSAGAIRAGDTVLDIGAGAGQDTLIASRMVGPDGHVLALDLTAAMTRKLGQAAAQAGADNVSVIRGSAEDLPLESGSVDVITSNGALNLVPGKRQAVREMFRVLRPGGRLQIADVVIDRPVTVDCHSDPRLWVECVVGATVDDDFLDLFRDAGFEDVELVRTLDYFAHSPSAQTREIAASFGARSIEVSMRRGPRPPSRLREWLRRLDPRRMLDSLWRRGLVGALAFVLAVVSCYGTLAAVAVLAMLGAGRAIDEGLWVGAIALFTLMAVATIAAGMRFHRDPGATVAALAGAGAIGYALFVDYHALLELSGFVVLAVAVWWDIRLRRRQESRVLGLEPADSHAQ
jgi:SAM-dependent methyltransferase